MEILSIDIDILFKDCFKYQNFIDTDLTAKQSWQVIEWKTGTQDYEIDMNCLNFIKNVIREKCKQSKFYVIEEHDEIIDIIKNTGKKYNIVTNFDYHHDISYLNDDSQLNIENWVKHGKNEDLIGGYLWVHQDSSEMCVSPPFNFLHSSWKELHLDNIKDFDIVVICVSPYFTPFKHWNIVKELIDCQ